MNIFEQATRQGIRFATKQGLLSTEQLWDLKPTPLAAIVRNLKKELNKDNDDELSFLDDTATPVDKTVELKFNVAKSIYVTKKEEREAEKNAESIKAHNAKIDALIARKQDEDMEGMTVEQLEALRK